MLQSSSCVCRRYGLLVSDALCRVQASGSEKCRCTQLLCATWFTSTSWYINFSIHTMSCILYMALYRYHLLVSSPGFCTYMYLSAVHDIQCTGSMLIIYSMHDIARPWEERAGGEKETNTKEDKTREVFLTNIPTRSTHSPPYSQSIKYLHRSGNGKRKMSSFQIKEQMQSYACEFFTRDCRYLQ